MVQLGFEPRSLTRFVTEAPKPTLIPFYTRDSEKLSCIVKESNPIFLILSKRRNTTSPGSRGAKVHGGGALTCSPSQIRADEAASLFPEHPNLEVTFLDP